MCPPPPVKLAVARCARRKWSFCRILTPPCRKNALGPLPPEPTLPAAVRRSSVRISLIGTALAAVMKLTPALRRNRNLLLPATRTPTERSQGTYVRRDHLRGYWDL